MKNFSIMIAIAICAACGADPGEMGEMGNDGTPGPQGEMGLTGPQGEVGPQGPQGVVGPQGVAGANGATGPQGAAGAAGSTGAAGANGATGPQGAAGAQGPAGLDGGNLWLLDGVGTQLGRYTMVPGYDTKAYSAFVAHRVGAPVSFPEGELVVIRRAPRMFFSDPLCAGPAAIGSLDAVTNLKNVYYRNVQAGPQLWVAENPAPVPFVIRSMRDSNGVCISNMMNGGDLVRVTLTPYGFDPVEPFSIEVY